MGRKITNTSKDALKLVGGGLVGAGLALLLAPRSGRATRRDLIRAAKSVGEKGEKAVDDLAHALEDRAAGMLQSGQKMTREVKKEMLSAIESGQESLGKQRQRLTRIFG